MGRPSEYLACKFENCNRDHHAKGYCFSHYTNFYWVQNNNKKMLRVR
jgi:HKD family nuclease